MKKIYSLVLMAAMLLVGTNAWAAGNVAKIGTTEYATLELAWAAVQNGQTIDLISDADISSTLWLGTDAMDDVTNVKSITLDLNGKTLKGNKALQIMFLITHGELKVVSTGATGTIIQEKNEANMNSSSWVIFWATGSTYKTVNPRTATSGYYTHLEIAENVRLEAKTANALVIDRIASWPNSQAKVAAGGATVPASLYNTNIYEHYNLDNKTYSDYGSAYGVRFDIKCYIDAYKYAIKTNGNLGSPIADKPRTARNQYKSSPNDQSGTYAVLDADTAYTPYVRLYGTSELRVQKNSTETKKPTAVYASGYARWLIEGTCIGSTAVYIKSGTLDIHDATIHSNYDGDYTAAKPQTGSGVTAAGSAIAIESSTAYAGDIDVTISGDTHVSATNGYAIDEAVNLPEGSTSVDAITITGGTFEGGDVRTKEQKNPTSESYVENPIYGTMVVSDITAELNAQTDTVAITIIGGSSTNGTDSVGNQTLAEFLADQSTTGTKTHITYVEDETGKQTMVISEGEAPATADPTDPSVPTTWDFIKTQAATQTRPSYQWTAIETDATIASGVVKLGELQINSATGAQQQKLTIADGATLQVERLIMNANAQIVVEAGGKLIVDGEQGIIAPVASNIILKASQDAQAIFLFNPAVTSNRHPNATVKMKAKQIGYVTDATSTKNWFWHRFAMPVEEADSWTKDPDVPTAIYEWSYANNDWANCGVAQMKPFLGYILTINQSTLTDVEYTFNGALAGGNSNANLQFQTDGFHFFGNSYTGHIYVDSLVSQLMGDSEIDGTVWVWYDDQNYHAVPLMALHNNPNAFAAWQKEIAPMQTFVFKHNVDAVGATPLNYASAIWNNPRYGNTSAAPAPRRRVADDNNHMRVVVTAENGKRDDVLFLEDGQCSDDFEKGYDAAKYMNENALNMFASINGEEYSVVATDNLEGKTLTVNTIEDVNYTMSFENVNGAEYAIRDNITGNVFVIEEGATYEFAAQPNSIVEGRFEIIGRNNAPTAIENTEVKANVKGIYTIMGQYLGEDFNALPAGIYVINGVKIVK